MKAEIKTAITEALTIVVVGMVAGMAYNAVATNGLYVASAAKVTGPEEIGLGEARRLFDEGALFVDARFAWDFEDGHVPGTCRVRATWPWAWWPSAWRGGSGT